MEFLQSTAFQEAVEGRADPSRIVLTGGSAGGWLALLCGLGIGFDESGLPRPPTSGIKGIAAIYPITDMQDAFWHTKQHPVSYMDKVVTREDVEPFINPDNAESRIGVDRSKGDFLYVYGAGVRTLGLKNTPPHPCS